MRKLLYIIITTILLAACVGGGKERAAFDAAQAIINDRPDSALAILDSLEPSSNEFPRPALRRWQLLRLMAQNKCDTVFRSDSLQRVLTEYYDRHGTPNEQMWAHYLLGRAYFDMGEAPMALECFQKAVESADTTAGSCDFCTLTAIYGQMADLYHLQYLPDNEMEALKKSELSAMKDNDTVASIKAYELRIRPYFLKNYTDSMMLVMSEARRRYLEAGDRKRAARAVYSAISILLDRRQYDDAKKYLDTYERESGNFDGKGELFSGGFYYYDKGRYMLAMGQRDSALSCFRRLVKSGMPEAAYKGLLSTYGELNEADSVMKYALLFAAANDSSYLHVNQENIQRVTAMYDYGRQRQLALQRQSEAGRWRDGAVIIILSSILAISILVYRNKLSSLKKQKDIEALVHTKETLQSLLEKKRHETVSLNGKNARLQRSHNEQVKKLELQIDILSRQLIGNAQEKGDTEEQKLAIQDFKDRFKEYSVPNRPPTEEDWERVSTAFRLCHPEFHRLVTASYAVGSEHARVCMMLMMDFSERMMALTLNVDGKHIDRRKRQANKKLFGEDRAGSLRENLLRLLGQQWA